MDCSGSICFTGDSALTGIMMKIFKLSSYYSLKAILLVSVIYLFTGCGQTGKTALNTTTSGTVTIGADDSYKPLVDAEVQVFQSLYENAKFKVKYEPEDSLFKDLLRDSVQFIVAGRQLGKDEESYLKGKQYVPEQVKIATDALAIIVNNDNPDTLFTMEQLKAIFKGDSTWAAPGNGKITVVFDHQNSSNSRYIQENLLNGGAFPSYCFAVKSNPEVIDYVSKNKNALGIIAVNWVSNDHDSATQGFLKKVKVAWISASANDNAFQPYPYYINNSQYPLGRDVYVIKTEPYVGLASGLLSFITADKGQRIILLEGIVPSHAVNHIISF